MEPVITQNPYFHNLMLHIKNMRVKHVRKMFVLLREIGTDLNLASLEHKTDWVSFDALNKRLQVLVVQHGLTLGEFATGYVLNIQARQRATPVSAPVPKPLLPLAPPKTATNACKRKATDSAATEKPKKNKK